MPFTDLITLSARKRLSKAAFAGLQQRVDYGLVCRNNNNNNNYSSCYYSYYYCYYYRGTA